ncbi:bifunctional indole-3-glycerol-phosphate synthase TrpC/phosphoribosylanthranilate isomerase TrpF [Ignatzschineria ureiclastica]|uniref:Multifunctional fusion protein n=1 Tax=Ignatzschineria ureiclastica TaxID=472582 RepID=A0A2U2ADE4_9GAMM|nr:bifunctional indole-3-glycerol-phosphate synthase TrpC/phosphoribosylanthranilate isomerase TrpF [Ignatzschineria ureiclastica]PWD80682.1 bifunctional indole-3-glycerol-phosphate synthase TrpC/phosphoribosylanthranilate isomerase TrpF [Ignatzschineria ureiclastica]GGZ95348.1 bifunctional indole-3-glycerol phosphate synthase/phosphoribosylanthranilate isomerase [Ignatzschineria ureiclastica]
MSMTVLESIVAQRRIDIAQLRSERSLQLVQDNIMGETVSEPRFYQAIETQKKAHKPAYILECKRASPSKGLIRSDFNLSTIISAYEPYATAISVLTENRHFGGSYEDLKQARQLTTRPLLCKDFIVDVYQLYLAKEAGADAVLLMLSVLRDDEYRYFAETAHTLGLGILTEVNNEAEVARALKLQARIIGINNRNLHDLSIDLSKTERLRALMPQDQCVISESGIHQYADIQRLRRTADGFLIGSHLMASDHLPQALQQLLQGGYKVCGLTSAEDAKLAYEAGATYGGLIFILSSPRGVTYHQAKVIRESAPLKWVGVFQNDDIDTIAFIAQEVGLSAVQLHGEEPQSYISKLRQLLPHHIQIIKALPVRENTLPLMDYQDVDYYLLDGVKGGSGEPFNWQLLANRDLSNCFIAGGISCDNISEVLQYPAFGLDINSKVEKSPGKKDPVKLQAIFQTLRAMANV